MAKRPVIYLYTDGASSGNPGPGGWGALLVCGELRKEMSGGFARTTNNRMELTAVIEGLKAIKWEDAEVEVWSDSQYVVKAVTEGWLENWIRKQWKKVKNPDLWQEFLTLYRRHRVTFHWIKGHAGHPENERCDRLAVEAYSDPAQLPEDAGFVEDNDNNLFQI
ncbi:MAG: ribonuclease HI [Bacteroidales bacterium]|nr:ribonuclease HI [Bacteroidales bacterium]